MIIAICCNKALFHYSHANSVQKITSLCKAETQQRRVKQHNTHIHIHHTKVGSTVLMAFCSTVSALPGNLHLGIKKPCVFKSNSQRRRFTQIFVFHALMPNDCSCKLACVRTCIRPGSLFSNATLILCNFHKNLRFT